MENHNHVFAGLLNALTCKLLFQQSFEAPQKLDLNSRWLIPNSPELIMELVTLLQWSSMERKLCLNCHIWNLKVHRYLFRPSCLEIWLYTKSFGQGLRKLFRLRAALWPNFPNFSVKSSVLTFFWKFIKVW